MRDRSIDVFRGIAIVSMVFFTVTLKLSSDIPDILRHNSSGYFHIGDLVLPMFLFASGLSLAYYIDKRDKSTHPREVVGRFGRLAAIGFLLSPISASGFLEMDEVMLSALLFLACVVLSKLDWRLLLCVILLIDLSYLAFIQPGWAGERGSDIFDGHYLGGYPAAPFYLPVMLTGLLIGRETLSNGLWTKRNHIVIASMLALFLFSWVLVPMDKMTASPSFMMFSILCSFVVFAAVRRLFKARGLEEMEYLGRNPLRYWIMMYAFFFIPIALYVEIFGAMASPRVTWTLAVMLSMCLLLLLWLASNVMDVLLARKDQAQQKAY